MIGFGDEHVVEALRLFWLIILPEDFQLIEALQAEADGAFGAIDLEDLAVLAPRAEARGLERADRTVLKFDDGFKRVVYIHLAHTFAAGERALFDKGLRHRSNAARFAD